MAEERKTSSKSSKRKIDEVEGDESDGKQNNIKRFLGASKAGRRCFVSSEKFHTSTCNPTCSSMIRNDRHMIHVDRIYL